MAQDSLLAVDVYVEDCFDAGEQLPAEAVVGFDAAGYAVCFDAEVAAEIDSSREM